MSAVFLRLAIILYFSGTALSDPVSTEVLWRDFGGTFTIQCISSEPDQEYIEVKKGLSEDFLKVDKSNQVTTAKELMSRLEVNAEFPNVDIHIKNLISEDTGLYWCMYKKAGRESTIIDGTRSVLVVVKGEGVASLWWDTSKENLVLMSVVISTAVILSLMMAVLMWLIKTKTAYTMVKPRRDPINHVYEIMTGTRTEDVCLQASNQPATP